MATDLIVRYLHFLAIFVVFSLLTIEHLFLKKEIEPKWFKKLIIIDMAYGIALLVTLLCGIGLWLWVGKPAGFYTDNWVFHTKIALFIGIGVLSFFPSGFIFRNKKHLPDTISVPTSIIWIVRAELFLLCLIPLMAVLMANGVGYI